MKLEYSSTHSLSRYQKEVSAQLRHRVTFHRKEKSGTRWISEHAGPRAGLDAEEKRFHALTAK
jgi:hypothetical protein